MDNIKRQGRGVLLASFITTDSEEEIMSQVESIMNDLELTNNLIFLLEDLEDTTKKILTYNIHPVKGQPYNRNMFTMRVHRKKQTNTLYTINALNQAIALDHDGETGKHLKLDWEKYTNSVMLSVKGELRVIGVRVAKIFKIEETE